MKNVLYFGIVLVAIVLLLEPAEVEGANACKKKTCDDA
uniref:Uncharacterized protein n=1 Tax=Acrobeloides nanus TaxID=290746 RepID=A0A914CY43_9BILA